jgi:hypothetical protein
LLSNKYIAYAFEQLFIKNAKGWSIAMSVYKVGWPVFQKIVSVADNLA